MAKNSPKHQALMSWLYAYGKRISETLNVNRQEVQLTEQGIHTRFRILKTRPVANLRPVKWKRIAHDHWLAPFLKKYIEFHDQAYSKYEALFPSWSASERLTRQGAWKILRKYNNEMWPHLFRHSLAVLMAQDRATVAELMAWFDWEDEKTAIGYVKTYGSAMDELADSWASRRF